MLVIRKELVIQLRCSTALNNTCRFSDVFGRINLSLEDNFPFFLFVLLLLLLISTQTSQCLCLHKSWRRSLHYYKITVFYFEHTVKWWLKARIVEREEASITRLLQYKHKPIARQWLCKHVFAALEAEEAATEVLDNRPNEWQLNCCLSTPA
jgi:hypothetical protein